MLLLEPDASSHEGLDAMRLTICYSLSLSSARTPLASQRYLLIPHTWKYNFAILNPKIYRAKTLGAQFAMWHNLRRYREIQQILESYR